MVMQYATLIIRAQGKPGLGNFAVTAGLNPALQASRRVPCLGRNLFGFGRRLLVFYSAHCFISLRSHFGTALDL